MISARDHVEHLAELDALAYVERHGRPYEGGEEDDAFLAEFWPGAMADAVLGEDEAAALLPVYRRALARETRNLASTGA